MQIDKVENTEEYKRIENELNEKIKIKLELNGYINENTIGFCHTYWALKKQILKSDYNIDWKSPAELNSEMIFD